jgi:predicted DNA-binding transcriptional regulator AlpA
MASDDRLLSEGEAAEYLGLSPHTLNRWRVVRAGPPFIKIGAKAVRYRLPDLAAWVESQRKQTNTGKGGVAC